MKKKLFVIAVLCLLLLLLPVTTHANPADINQDGKIDEIDLFVVIASFRGPIVAPGSDINSDGKTDEADCFLVDEQIDQANLNIWLVLRQLLSYFNTGRYPGDFNRDGKVDVLDLAIVGSNKQETQGLPGDINKDGKVDVNDVMVNMNYSDLQEVKTNFGITYYIVTPPNAAPARPEIPTNLLGPTITSSWGAEVNAAPARQPEVPPTSAGKLATTWGALKR